jgi:pilus assembly protein Flp/PilA
MQRPALISLVLVVKKVVLCSPLDHPINPTGGEHRIPLGETLMKDTLLKLAIKMQVLLDEEGQDLIEYALVVALIAFAATAGMGSLAASLNQAFTNIGTKVTGYIT